MFYISDILIVHLESMKDLKDSFNEVSYIQTSYLISMAKMMTSLILTSCSKHAHHNISKKYNQVRIIQKKTGRH